METIEDCNAKNMLLLLTIPLAFFIVVTVLYDRKGMLI